MLLSRWLILALFTAGALPACDALSGSGPPTPPTTLEAAQARWAARGPAAYRFRFERSCYCTPSHLSATVVVRGDTVQALRDVHAHGTPVRDPAAVITPGMVRSVEQLFALIRTAAGTTIDSVAVTYDAERGYPRLLRVDPFRAMATEDITYAVRDVVALDPLAAD